MKDTDCGNCKHFAQGKNCSFCANPKQTNEDYKTYLYYSFLCGLFEKGIHKSREEYMKSLNR